jgi:hypothetical protein
VARQVSTDTAWTTARAAFIRQACNHMDPTGEGHDHEECLRDDTAYIADRMLRLLAAVVGNDDDTILSRLDDLRDAIKFGDAA